MWEVCGPLTSSSSAFSLLPAPAMEPGVISPLASTGAEKSHQRGAHPALKNHSSCRSCPWAQTKCLLKHSILNLTHFLPTHGERRSRSCVAGAPGDSCEFLGKDKACQRIGSGITQSLPREGKIVSSIQKAPLPASPSARNFLSLVKGSL